MNFIHHLDKRDKDKDLDRIVRLYDIIKRYELLVEHLLDNQSIIDSTGSYSDIVQGYERAMLKAALRATGGNVTATARNLQINNVTLDRYIKRLGLLDETQGAKAKIKQTQEEAQVESV